MLSQQDALRSVRHAAQVARRLERARDLWCEVAPAEIQIKSRVLSLDQGVLTVLIPGPVQAERARREAGQLARRLAARWTAIRDIRIVQRGNEGVEGGRVACR